MTDAKRIRPKRFALPTAQTGRHESAQIMPGIGAQAAVLEHAEHRYRTGRGRVAVCILYIELCSPRTADAANAKSASKHEDTECGTERHGRAYCHKSRIMPRNPALPAKKRSLAKIRSNSLP